MQNVTITSTTDTPEEIQAALGHKAETKSAPEEKEKPAAEVNAKETEHETAETDEVSEASDDDEINPAEKAEGDGKDADAKPAKKGGFKRRIDKLTKEREYWREKFEDVLRTQKTPGESKGAPEAKPAQTGKPDPKDFESHADYTEALTEWKVDQKLKDRDQKAKESEIKTQAQKAQNDYQQRAKEFSEKTPDYYDVLAEVNDIVPSMTIQECLLRSDNGPELAYALAKNPDDFERINKLPALEAAWEIGKLEARLAKSESAAAETKPKSATTKAPAPIKPVGSKTGATSTKSPDEMDHQEYRKWRAGKK